MTDPLPLGWMLARSFGLLAYTASFLSVLFGVFVGSGGVGGLLPKPLVLELHRRWALAAGVATAAHVVIVVTDPASDTGPLAAFVPFAGSAAVAVGSVAAWGLVALAVTSAAPRRFPAPVWRAVHGTAFGTFALTLGHGFAAGTDTGNPAVLALYVVTAATLVGAVVTRVLVSVGRAAA